MKNLLLGGLAKVALGRVELGLEEGNLAGKALADGLGGLALVQVELGLSDSVLGLLELILDQRELVLQGGDLVVLLGLLVLKALDLGLGGGGTGIGSGDLLTKGSEFLIVGELVVAAAIKCCREKGGIGSSEWQQDRVR
jgi:hypothetical protein